MSKNEQKRTIAEMLIHDCPYVVLLAQRQEVVVPDFLKTNNNLVLQIGRDPAVMGMPDLVIDDTGFRATISVKGARHFVDVPWNAVTSIYVVAPNGAEPSFVALWPPPAEEVSKPRLRSV